MIPCHAHHLRLLCAAGMIIQGFASGAPQAHAGIPGGFSNFGTVNMEAAVELDGEGVNVDSIAFWEAPDPNDTLMFVTGKDNDRLEVWRFPFLNHELTPIQFPANINGVAVDQETDLLYVSDRIVTILSLPGLQTQGTFGQGILGVGENNLDILKHTNGQTWIYVSDDHSVHRFDAATQQHLGAFAPPVSSIETVLADDFYQMILVPEEQGPTGGAASNPGVHAYHPDGTPFERNGTNLFGHQGEFDSDEEGMLLYTFPASGVGDDGTGFIVVSDQRADITDFEVFDRQTWAHLGRFRLSGVSNTDGIASTQRALPGYPLGVFAAINNDTTTALLGWDDVFEAIGWDLAPETVRITPDISGPTDTNSIAFAVEFSEAVTGFNDAADLVITHDGTSHSGVVITGSGANHTVTVSGIRGVGSFTLAVSTTSDVADHSGHAHEASVTSPPVRLGTAYHAWAAAKGLSPGVNDGVANDPDGDGCPNVEEFATDGNPLTGPDSGKTRLALEELSGVNYFTYTFPVRNAAVFAGEGMLSATVDGVVYSLSGSADLGAFDLRVWELTPALILGLPVPSEGWSYRTFRLDEPIAEPSAGFTRLIIEAATP